jgi:2-keto-4-pentenoate hydratase/2-oxohepta-3-ene-1,7-dioic acid hydratase in catechol pathway
MRLISFLCGSDPRAGILTDEQRVVPLTVLEPTLPEDLTSVVVQWRSVRDRLEAALRSTAPAAGMPLKDVSLCLPFRPRRIIATGGNYADHLEEMGSRAPEHPSASLKLPCSAQGPETPLALDAHERYVDYEGEIAVVIGKPARAVSVQGAAAAIAGVMLANDITSRDVPAAHIVLAKGRRGFCTLGPMLVTAEQLDLRDLTFAVHVNGELRQTANTATMVHGVADIVASYSRALTLQPGDLILTGTPAGVGVGRRPPAFLRPGDEVVVSSPELGVLRTPIVSEPSVLVRSRGVASQAVPAASP